MSGADKIVGLVALCGFFFVAGLETGVATTARAPTQCPTVHGEKVVETFVDTEKPGMTCVYVKYTRGMAKTMRRAS